MSAAGRRLMSLSQLGGAYYGVPDFLDTQHPIRDRQDADYYLARLEQFARNLDRRSRALPPRRRRSAWCRRTSSSTRRSPASSGCAPRRPPRRRWCARSSAAPARGECGRRLGGARRGARGGTDRRRPGRPDRGAAREPAGRRPRRRRLAPARGRGLLRLGHPLQHHDPMTGEEIHRTGLDQVAGLQAELDRLLQAQGYSQGVGRRPAQRDERGGALPLSQHRRGPRRLARRAQPPGRGDHAAAAADVQHASRGRGSRSAGSRSRSRSARRAAIIRAPRSTARGRALIISTCATRTSGRASACRPSPITRRSPATISRSRSRARPASCRSTAAPRASRPINEGWALYAERVADELGVYADDPFGRIGYLQSYLFRAVRLVVDSGLHHQRWSREQAVRYMMDNAAEPEGSRGPRDRALLRLARPGLRLQGRPDSDRQPSRRGRAGDGHAVRHQGLPRPRCCSADRCR